VAGTGAVGLSRERDDDGSGDFSLTYDKMRSLVEEYADKPSAVMSKTGFVSMGRAYAEDRWEDLGKVETIERTIDFNGENKRHYPQRPATGADLLATTYDSKPWDVHLLSHQFALATQDVF